MKRIGSRLVKQESFDFHFLVRQHWQSKPLVDGKWQWVACVFQGWSENKPGKWGQMDEKIVYELLVYSLTFFQKVYLCMAAPVLAKTKFYPRLTICVFLTALTGLPMSRKFGDTFAEKCSISNTVASIYL